MAIPDVDLQSWAREEGVEAHRFTREEYEQVRFGPDRRVELVNGVIYELSPQSSQHARGIAKATRALLTAFGPGFHVRPQLPLALGPHSMPEPDLAMIAGEPDDAADHPSTAALVVEVTETSQLHDRERKARDYARAGIPDYWILNLRLDAIEVLRNPQDGLYHTRFVFRRGETISPLARPEVAIPVADLLPRAPSPVS